MNRRLFKTPEHADTITRYAQFFGFMITAYYQSFAAADPPLPAILSPTQSLSIQTLCESAAAENVDLVQVHDALKSLVLYRYTASQTTVKHDPTFMFTLWANWNRDGSFNPPNTITQDFAKMAFVAKCVVLMDLYFIQQNTPPPLENEAPLDYDQSVFFYSEFRNVILILNY